MFGPPARLQMMSGNRSWTASTEHDMFSSKTTGKQSRRYCNDDDDDSLSLSLSLSPFSFSLSPFSFSLSLGQKQHQPGVVEVITKDLIRNLK